MARLLLSVESVDSVDPRLRTELEEEDSREVAMGMREVVFGYSSAGDRGVGLSTV